MTGRFVGATINTTRKMYEDLPAPNKRFFIAGNVDGSKNASLRKKPSGRQCAAQLEMLNDFDDVSLSALVSGHVDFVRTRTGLKSNIVFRFEPRLQDVQLGISRPIRQFVRSRDDGVGFPFSRSRLNFDRRYMHISVP